MKNAVFLLVLLPTLARAQADTSRARADSSRAHAARTDTARTDTARAHADTSADDEATPRFGAALGFGVIHFTDGSSNRSLSASVQYRVVGSLSVGVGPSLVRAASATGRQARMGVTDLPVSVGIGVPLPGRRTPALDLSLTATLPTGNTATGFGAGHVTFNTDVGLGFDPLPHVSLYGSAWHDLSGESGSALDMAATSVSGSASFDLGRFSTSVSFGTDLAASDSLGTHSQTVAAGLAVPLLGPVSLTVDGSRRLSGVGARWTLLVGLGSTYLGAAETQFVGSLGRLRAALPHQGRTKGKGKTGNGTRGHGKTKG